MSDIPAPTQNTTSIERHDRLQILLTEMELLQGRFDKYDDLIFRNREWVITVVVALLGAALTLSLPQLGVLASWVPALFFLKHQYGFRIGISTLIGTASYEMR